MSSHLERYVLPVLVCAAISTAIQEANATAISQVTASANWNTFIATLNGQDINFGAGQSSVSNGTAEYVDNTGSPVTHGASGWGDTDALSSIPNAVGHGYTSTASLNADGSGIADGTTNAYGRGTAYAYRIGYFDLTNATALSTLQVSLEFDLQHFFSYDPLTDFTGGYNEYAIALYYVDPSGISTKITEDRHVFRHYSGNTSDCGPAGNCNGIWTLTDALSINDYELAGGLEYGIDAFLYTDANARTPAVAVIPEPSILSLLAFALAGFAAMRCRKSD
jgi:hypothetical protein